MGIQWGHWTQDGGDTATKFSPHRASYFLPSWSLWCLVRLIFELVSFCLGWCNYLMTTSGWKLINYNANMINNPLTAKTYH